MSETLLERCAFLAESAAGNPTHYMVEQALEQAELDWRFLTFEVDPHYLAQALDGLDVLGFRGVLLASEFRSSAMGLIQSIAPRARDAGSINCLVRKEGQLEGDNTQGAALIESLGGPDSLADRGVLVIGSGRVARTMATAAQQAGVAALHLTDSDEAALATLEDQMGQLSDAQYSVAPVVDNIAVAPAGVNIVVFAPDSDDHEHLRPVIDTSASGQALTFVDTRLRGSRTGLLKFADELGATIIDGVELFARETALALEQWTGLGFDRAPLRELSEEFLGV